MISTSSTLSEHRDAVDDELEEGSGSGAIARADVNQTSEGRLIIEIHLLAALNASSLVSNTVDKVGHMPCKPFDLEEILVVDGARSLRTASGRFATCPLS